MHRIINCYSRYIWQNIQENQNYPSDIIDTMRLFHYTTIETLALILNSKSIKFSRLDQLDDKTESEPFAEFNPLSYIFSCSLTDDPIESIPMWKMYSNMETGIRIEFDSNTMFAPTLQTIIAPEHKHEVAEFPKVLYSSLHASDILNSDYFLSYWDSRDEDSVCQCIKLKPVSYINDFKDKYQSLLKISDTVENSSPTRQISYNPCNFGFYKSKYWEFQKEVRFLIYATPFAKDNKEISEIVSGKRSLSTTYILVPLSQSCLENIKITLAPKISEPSRLIVTALLAKFPHAQISDSCLLNTIR